MRPVLLMARFTLREAIRKRMVLATLVLSALFIGLYAYGFSSLRANYFQRELEGFGSAFDFSVFASVMVLLGLYTVNFLAGVMAIFASVGAIAAEIDAGTLHAILPKPISRWQVVVGKWLGYAVMLAAYVALMCASVFVVARLVGGYDPPNRVAGTGLVVLVSLLLLSLTVLGSAFFSSLTNGIVVFMLYGVALMGGIVHQIGQFLENTTLTAIGEVTTLLVPSDAVWRLASGLMQRSGDLSIQVVQTPFTAAIDPNPQIALYGVAYALGAVALSTWVFARRDL